MPAIQKDLFIEQGATFVLSFTWYHEDELEPGEPGEPYDLTGAHARMQIRKKRTEPVLIEADDTNGKIALGGTAGTVVVTLADEDTDLLDLKSAAYDLEIEFADGRVTRLMQGKVTVSPNITHEDD